MMHTKLAFLVVFVGFIQNFTHSQGNRRQYEPQNGTYGCPRPRVGTCSCNCHRNLCKVSCHYLDAMPEHLPPNVTHLEIGAGIIQQVPKDYFLNHDLMFTLKITDNRLSNKFRLPKKVKDLSLRGNKLNGSTLYGMFGGFTGITKLDLSDNTISDNIIPGTFKSLKNLRTLYLEKCNINKIHNDTFDGLHFLTDLRISQNPLKRISKDTFKGIKSQIGLQIRIQVCLLEDIEKGTFKDMPFVRTLLLNQNQLTSFPDLLGIGEDLQQLDLSYNNISDISGIAKSGIKALLQLDLSNNRIESILPEHFENITIFTYLSLSDNRIKKIPAGILKKSSNLIQLILQNNEIEVIEKGSFDGMANLKEIFLFNNKLDSLPDDIFDGMSLRNLFLNNNKFTNLTGRPFRGMKKTKTLLYLFSNHIGHIENNVFEDLGDKTTIALRCRSLVNLPLIEKSSLGQIICTPYNLPPIKGLNGGVSKSLYSSGFKCIRHHPDDWECIICKSGTYGNGKKDSTGCVDCPAGGFYQEEMGQTQCKRCSVGTFVHPDNAPGHYALNCKACPRGTQSNKHAGYRACTCLQGFYRFDRFDMCWACPAKGLNCSNDYAILRQGYYWEWTNLTSKQQYRDFINNLMIKTDEFVHSVWKYTGTLPKPHKCLRDRSCLGGLSSNCAKGYQGPLCAMCKADYFERMDRCIRCPSKLRAGLEIAGVIIAFIVILLVLLWGDKRRVLSGRSIADVILSCFKIVIGFYQVMAGLYTCFSNIEWPTSIVWMQKALRFVELNVLEFAPLSCLSPKLSFNALQQFVVVLVSNAAVVLAILIYLAVRVLQHRNRKGSASSYIAESIAHTKSSCIRNVCVFLFATYPKTCTSIIQILSVNCIPLCAHNNIKQSHCTHYLRNDVSIQCQTPRYQTYSKVALGFLIYPVGLPVVMTLLVWHYVHKPSRAMADNREIEMPQPLQEDIGYSSIELCCDQRKSPFKSGLSLFYENYRPECWYWETVEMARKLVLTSGLTLIGKHSRTQIGLGSIISALFAVLYVYFHPIANSFENHLQTVALMAIFLNLGIGVMLKETDESMPVTVNQRNDKVGVSILMVIINSAVIFILIVSCFKIIIKRLYKWCKTDDRKVRCAECFQTFGTFCFGLLTPSKLVNSNYQTQENYHIRDRLLEESSGHK